jgi:hypothetical protein
MHGFCFIIVLNIDAVEYKVYLKLKTATKLKSVLHLRKKFNHKFGQQNINYVF